MTQDELEELKSRLKTMDLPILRVLSLPETSSITWLFRNISIRNWDHPSFNEILMQLRRLRDEGVS